jgi:hypothetical protein
MRRSWDLSAFGLSAWVAAAFAWAIAGVRAAVPLQDPDQGWLAWAGRRALAGDYPRANLASYTAPELPWVLHEPWPAAVAAVALDHLGWVRAGVLGFIAVMALRLASRPACAWSTALALAPMPMVLYFGLSERAMSWGIAALAVVVSLLFSGAPKDSMMAKRIAPWRFPAAAAVIWLWAQAHGSFVVGLGLLAVASPAWAAIAALGCLVNPSGPALYGLIFDYVVGRGTVGHLGDGIVEWAWLDVTDPAQVFALAWVVGVGVLFWAVSVPDPLGAPDRRATWTARLLHAVFLVLVLRSWRNAPLAGVALLPFVAARLEQALAGRVTPRALGRPLPLLLVGLVAGLALIPTKPWEAAFPGALLPSLAGRRVWADHRLGGWLMLHGVPVFWDGRNDCYPPEVWADGLVIERAAAGYRARLDAWHVDAVLTESPALTAALRGDGWTVAAADRGVLLLRR